MVQLYVKIYGLPKTCTSWAALVVEKNYKVKCLSMILGSKHSNYIKPMQWLAKRQEKQWQHGLESVVKRDKLISVIDDGGLQYIVCIKNIYATLVSQMPTTDYPRDDDKEFEQKLRDRCRCCCDSLRSWLQCLKHGSIVRHEDVMCDYGIATAEELSDNLKLARRADTPTLWLPRQKLAPQINDGMVMFSPEHIDSRRTWYLGDGYMQQLSDRAVTIIDDETDWNMYKEYGYKKSELHSDFMTRFIREDEP